jgi:hypothetical protein
LGTTDSALHDKLLAFREMQRADVLATQLPEVA